MDLLVETAYWVLVPAIWTLFMILLAFFIEWLFRKLTGHMQNRVGPLLAGKHGILQPFADFIKLFNKEVVSPEGTDDLFVDIFAVIGVWVAIMLSMFYPIFGYNGILAFEGDAIVLMGLIALGSIIYIATPFLFPSPYPSIGAGRRAELYLAYEIPMFLALVVPIFIVGSINISDIIYAPFIVRNGIPAIVIMLPALIVAIISAMARLKKIPFDAPEAETEIAGGWEAELSGKRLAFFNLLTDLKIVCCSALIVTFFLGGPIGPTWMIEGWEWLLMPLWCAFWFFLKMIVVIFIFAAISASTARFRIDQVLNVFWHKLLPLGIIQVLILLVIW